MSFVYSDCSAVICCMQLQNVSMLSDDIEAQQKFQSDMLTPDKRLRRSPGTALRSPSSTSAGPCTVSTVCCSANAVHVF